MSNVKNIAKNTMVLLIAQIISTGMGFFYLAVIARYLGDTGFGTISFALALIGILMFFTDWGLTSLITRDVARTPQIANKFLGTAIALKLPVAAITALFICLAAVLMDYPPDTRMVLYIMALSMTFSSFVSLLNALFQGFGKMQYQALGQLLNGAIMLAGALAIKQMGLGLVGFAWVYCIASGAVLLFNIIVCLARFARPSLEIDMAFIRATLKESLPFGLSGLFMSIFYYISSVILFNVSGSDSAGWYNGAYRLIVFVLFIPSVVNVSIFPVMSRLFVTSRDMLRFATEKYFKYMAMLGIPMGIGTLLLAGRIIGLILGPGFENSAIALQILIWSAVFLFMGSPFTRLLETSNNQIAVTKITLLCMATNVVLNIMLIPYFGYIGAAVTTVFTELISMALCMYSGSRIYDGILKNGFNDMLKATLSTLPMVAFILLFNSLDTLLIIPISAVVYFIALYLLGGFKGEDIALFKSAIERKVSDK
jgi:O-antigen/teichoic acid export membrane protein